MPKRRVRAHKVHARKIHKGICHSLGIAAGTSEMCLWSYYGGLSAPLAYGVSPDVASVTLAPALQGFSITAGVLGVISIACGIGALISGNMGVGIGAGVGLAAATAFMCTAIALAQYESLLLDGIMDGVMANIETACLALGGVIFIAELASLAAGKC